MRASYRTGLNDTTNTGTQKTTLANFIGRQDLIFSHRYLLLIQLVSIFTILISGSKDLVGQNIFYCEVIDSSTQDPLVAVNVFLENTQTGTTTDLDGVAVLRNIPDGQQHIEFQYVGYETLILAFDFPLTDSTKVHQIVLHPVRSDLETVIVSSSRTNARIEDLPMKVEVLGLEEMDEESTLVPSGIGSILGDLSIITIQRANPVNGNDVVRMQGLDARYTQLLRDGLPLYGGFSGSLGVLSIPPLDLKQVEIIKGSASTLYGGGAIGGLINFISREPGPASSTTMILNGTTLGEVDVNSFTGTHLGKVGMTLFTGVNFKSARDVDADGFAEVPFNQNFNLHPRFFFNVGKNNQVRLGYTGIYDRRKGGVLAAIRQDPGGDQLFSHTEETYRHVLDLQVQHEQGRHQIAFKFSGTNFDRSLKQPDFNFRGQQTNIFAELNDLISWSKQSLVTGLNFNGEYFQNRSAVPGVFDNYHYVVPGIFLQHTLEMSPKLSLESGLRVDHHNIYGAFVLPRVALFYKPVGAVSARFAYGTGYQCPSVFDLTEPDPSFLQFSDAIKAEYSHGFNADINWHTVLSNDLGITLNQAFYFTRIRQPNTIVFDSDSTFFIDQPADFIRSKGTDSYLQLDWQGWECYLGFNFTEAIENLSGRKVNLAFNPKKKISTVLAYETGDWRMGIEGSLSGNQYVNDNKKVPDFWFFAAMVQRNFNFGSLVLNCENLFDVRQSRRGSIVEGNLKQPIYVPLYMPVEGRVVNLALRVEF
ncbi:MAG: TonB-dependent receptor [Saprospiraceae bacterium]|nr:TonB-dependent receptor [Saprospiraceae bacterium]